MLPFRFDAVRFHVTSAAALAATLLAVLGTACSRVPPPGQGDGTVALGVGAIPGRPGYASVLRGLELAVSRLNESRTVRFRLQLPTPGSSSAVRVAEQLRNDPSVIGVIGHPESGTSIEAIPVYADAEHDGASAVVAVSPTASSPTLTGINPWFFRIAPSDDVAARYVADWVRDSLHATRAAIVYRNDSYGREWSATFGEAFERRGATVLDREPYLTGVTEWEAYARLIAARRPDVLLFPGDAPDAIELLRALGRLHVQVPFVGGDGTEAMRSAPEAQGARFVAFFRPEQATSAEGQRFLQRFRDRFKEEPDMFAALSYDAALALGRSVLGGATTRQAVKEALERLGNGAPPIEGAAGPISFQRNHDIAGRTVLITTIGGGR